MPSAVPKAPSADIREAVRDTVAYRHQQPDPPRSRPSRGYTTSGAPPSTKPTSRRSQSEDSSNIVEKPRSSGKPRPKKGSQHADVIDRLDFTGVGPMFHHDGPFDACAPSRNKHKTKAPMHAWTGKGEDPQAQYANASHGAYPSAYASQAFSNDYPEPPKKKVDAIAEAWGIHEPEPFEEFFAGGGRAEGDTPASSIYNGKDGRSSQARPKDEGRVRNPMVRRPGVPPPQPIFVGGDPAEDDQFIGTSPPANAPGFPKRSKSLMHRIRKMRDAPNVPVSSNYDQQPSSSPPTPTAATSDAASRPTHRSQNSFLGRFGVKTNQSAPTHPKSETPEPYIFIDNQNRQDKALPATPRGEIDATSRENALPQVRYSEDNLRQDVPQQQQLGRKTSLIKKVGRVVRGGR